jgi:hypothetical protein
VKYLRAFLEERGREAPDTLPMLPAEPSEPGFAGSAGSAGRLTEVPEDGPTPPARYRALGECPPCEECGRTDSAISLVSDDGGRACSDCTTGRTALRRNGVPI